MEGSIHDFTQFLRFLNMGRPIALGSTIATIAHAYNKLRSVKVEIPQNNFIVSV